MTRHLVRFICGLALGVMPIVWCSGTTKGGEGGSGGNGEQPCQFPLSDYCEGSDCPTCDHAVAEAEELGRQRCPGWPLDAYSGPCGDLKYIFIGDLGGTIEYFDAAGALVADALRSHRWAAAARRPGALCGGRRHLLPQSAPLDV